ncbi:MAG: oligosaccharide flippase family protein [Patescibacteria group bacterium]
MHSTKRIASNSLFYTGALILQKILSTLYFWYYSNNLPGGASDVGRFNFVLSFVTLFFIIGDLGLYLVFLRESSKSPDRANRYLNTLLTIKLPLMVLAILVILGLSHLHLADNFLLLALALIWILLDSLTALFYAVLRSRQNLKYESIAVIIYQLIVIGIGAASIKLSGNIIYLIIALIIGTGLNLIFSATVVIFKLKFKIRLAYDPSIVKFFLKALPAFTVAGILVKILNSLDTVLIKQLTDDFRAVAFYTIPLKIVTVLSLTLPTALMGALYPAFSSLSAYKSPALNKIWEKSIEYLLIISLPIGFGFLALGQNIISALWKPEYLSAVLPGKIMLFALPFIFIAFPTGNLLNAIDRQKCTAFSRGLGVITLFLLSIILIPKFYLIGAAIAMLCTHIVIVCSDIYFLRDRFLLILPALSKSFARILLASFVMFAIIKILALYLPWYSLILIGGGAYFGVLWAVGGIDAKAIFKYL